MTAQKLQIKTLRNKLSKILLLKQFFSGFLLHSAADTIPVIIGNAIDKESIQFLSTYLWYIAGAILYGDRNFTSPQVFLNLFISNAGLIIAAVGMTFVLITGGIDISIGSVIGVVCMMLAWMMEVKHMSAVVAIILVLAFGVIFGLVQGFLVAYLKIQPFIVTLGGMFFARGLTALISSDMISIENPTFLSLANYRIYFGFITYYNNRGVAMHPYIYLSVVIALLVVAISFVILRYTKLDVP